MAKKIASEMKLRIPDAGTIKVRDNNICARRTSRIPGPSDLAIASLRPMGVSIQRESYEQFMTKENNGVPKP